MDDIKICINYLARLIEIIGVLILVLGTVVAISKYLLSAQGVAPRSYKILRQQLGKIILLGLEILVAADIVATVVTEPTMDRVLALGVIVIIRTFLSFSIQVEIEGKLPWQKNSGAEK